MWKLGDQAQGDRPEADDGPVDGVGVGTGAQREEEECKSCCSKMRKREAPGRRSLRAKDSDVCKPGRQDQTKTCSAQGGVDQGHGVGGQHGDQHGQGQEAASEQVTK